MESLSIGCIFFAITVICFHSTGAICLLKTNRNFRDNIELFSLSLSSVFHYILSIFRFVLSSRYPTLSNMKHNLHHVPIIIFHDTLFEALIIPILSSMIALTVQRFFAIRLHLRYESSWVYLYRTHIIIASWIFAFIVFVVTMTIGLTKQVDPQIWEIMDAILSGISLLAINVTFFTVYIYIYIKFKRATQATRNSIYHNQNNAKFFTPFIICGSFFTFGTLPYLFISFTTDIRYVYIGTYIDGIMNSIVYIFLNEKVVNRIQRWKNSIRNQ